MQPRSEPCLQDTGDIDGKTDERSSQRIEGVERCYQVQEEYACANEYVVPDGCTNHNERLGCSVAGGGSDDDSLG